jgi:hypothetical protein
MIMAGSYFICGLQLVFLTTHLPSYLQICGMDPMLSAQALGTIGGFNVLGSLFFGWAGGRWNKLLLLGGIYLLRSHGEITGSLIRTVSDSTLQWMKDGQPAVGGENQPPPANVEGGRGQ